MTIMRVVTANNSFQHACTEEMLFEQLLSGLPDEYSTTQAVIDAQSNLMVQDKLHILTKQEDRLATDSTQKALVARSIPQCCSESRCQPRYDSRSESEGSHQDRLTCWACKAHGHLVQDCPMLSQLQTIMKKLSLANLQMEKTKNKKSSSGWSTKGKTSTTKDKNTSANTSCHCHKGHITDNNLLDADTESSNSDSSELDEDEIEEVAAHSQDLGKVRTSLWVLDTGATAHMTDQRQLFRSLVHIMLNTIRVVGGKLYSWHMGFCELRVPSGRTVLLKDVLFVPNLGVNLLSSRKICSQPGVKGSFDSQTMYFTCGNEKIMRVDIQGGIYIVSWIAKGLEETAFCAMAPVMVNRLPSQPRIMESRQLQTNIAESQSLQPRSADSLPSRSI